MSIDNNDTKALTACKMPAQSLPPSPFSFTEGQLSKLLSGYSHAFMSNGILYQSHSVNVFVTPLGSKFLYVSNRHTRTALIYLNGEIMKCPKLFVSIIYFKSAVQLGVDFGSQGQITLVQLMHVLK